MDFKHERAAIREAGLYRRLRRMESPASHREIIRQAVEATVDVDLIAESLLCNVSSKY